MFLTVLDEGYYAMFALELRLSQIRLSSRLADLSVTLSIVVRWLVHPTQRVELFRNIFESQHTYIHTFFITMMTDRIKTQELL